MTSDSSSPHADQLDIGGYLLGALDPEETRRAEEHLTGCAECRAEVESLRTWSGALENVPDVMLLDGPPEDGDLLWQRTLRQIRSEAADQRRRRHAMTGVAAAVVASAVLGGVLLGPAGDEAQDATAQPQPQPSVTADRGSRTASAADATTGARLAVAVQPAPGWVRLHATVSGIPQGQRCRLLVVGRDGSTVLAGSWLVSERGAGEGTTLDGSALIDPTEVDSVRVETTDGTAYVSVKL
ncbi:anti-sigma factor [Micromonospora sp. ALFpr18c]|uniref:zf-HC2 domain-containing protein n=1 Tax=Micromonospora sp. ALFpr18c TaxID=1458665 RepID=UPI00124B28FD|nr:zf-HC2 domain-containing protein [Micromonospora sp. ALFpr18c]KAB1947684.1 anti-sigma factor [Micromonospora sp. ALFpr18c]